MACWLKFLLGLVILTVMISADLFRDFITEEQLDDLVSEISDYNELKSSHDDPIPSFRPSRRPKRYRRKHHGKHPIHGKSKNYSPTVQPITTEETINLQHTELPTQEEAIVTETLSPSIYFPIPPNAPSSKPTKSPPNAD